MLEHYALCGLVCQIAVVSKLPLLSNSSIPLYEFKHSKDINIKNKVIIR